VNLSSDASNSKENTSLYLRDGALSLLNYPFNQQNLAPFASRRLIVRSVVCFSELAALACGCRNGPDAADSESRLQLEERFAIAVSDSVPLSG
jgi:hypothetical protein